MHTSICSFKLKLENEAIIKVKAYDESAEFCYKNLKKKDFLAICGTIKNSNEVEVEICEILKC